MRVDCSEIKTYRGCKRQWVLSSRNRFHLRPVATPPQLIAGTLFHEALHSLYLGTPVAEVMKTVEREVGKDPNLASLLAMVPGYAKNVLPGDLDRFEVLDIEHKFDFVPTNTAGEVIDPDLHICGSIDMICKDQLTGAIYGFEHKTAKKFRDSSYLWMDEQPRLYYYALGLYVEEYNKKQLAQWQQEYEAVCKGEGVEPGDSGIIFRDKPIPATLGGVYLNEVKKLVRGFDYNRTLCTYPADDMKNFMWAFVQSCRQCKHDVECDDPGIPNPSYFACQMCSYRAICETYMYSTLDKSLVLAEFEDEYAEREEDHLDEKVERSKNGNEAV